MRRVLVAALVVAFAVAASAAPAMAGDKGPANAWGKIIKVQCTESLGEKTTYGQLWRTLKREMRENPDSDTSVKHMGVKPSAKRFVLSGALDTHCPIAAPTAPKVKVKGKGWGLLIRVQCTASFGEKVTYGQLWRTLKREMRENPDSDTSVKHMGVQPSAKRFARNALDTHCPVS